MASAVKLVQLSAAVVLGLLLCETAVAARPSASTFGGLSAVAHGRGLLGVRPAADLNGNSCLDCSEALACMVPSTACDRSGANYVLRVNLSNCKDDTISWACCVRAVSATGQSGICDITSNGCFGAGTSRSNPDSPRTGSVATGVCNGVRQLELVVSNPSGTVSIQMHDGQIAGSSLSSVSTGFGLCGGPPGGGNGCGSNTVSNLCLVQLQYELNCEPVIPITCNPATCPQPTNQCQEAACVNNACVIQNKNGGTCTTSNGCKTGTCSGGTCSSLQNVLDGTTCTNPSSDLFSCTRDACQSGVCTNVPTDNLCPSDGKSCTTETCAPSDPQANPNTGCKSTPTDNLCPSDGKSCTTETCAPIDPQANPTTGCKSTPTDALCPSDGKSCTTETCAPSDPFSNAATGCKSTPTDALCPSDGKSCTTETCAPNDPFSDAATGCKSTPTDALCPSDGYSCTTETCAPNDSSSDAATGCKSTPDDSVCNDSDKCTDNACLGSNGGNAGTGCKFTDVTVLSQQGCPDMPPNGLKASAEATSTITFNSDCVTKDTPDTCNDSNPAQGCARLYSGSAPSDWYRCNNGDIYRVDVGQNPDAEGEIYGFCKYTTSAQTASSAACSADEDACTQDVCSAGVCGKDFDINLLDGDLDDDATTCPTKAQLVALISSVDLDTTCLDDIDTNVCSAGDDPLDGLSECETLTARSGALTWKRCKDSDDKTVIVGFAVGANNEQQDVYASCTYTTNTVACAADEDACTQDVCSAGVCEKDFDINLLDGDLDDDATTCPTKAQLVALISSVDLDTTCLDDIDTNVCSAGDDPLDGLSECETLTARSGALTWKRCKDSVDNTVIFGFAVGANNEQQDVYASCTYTTNTVACAADEDSCTQDVCSAGVCEKDFDINLLDGDLDDDATTCPTKDQLVALISSVDLDTICLDGIDTNVCSAGDDPLDGLSECETLTARSGALTWKRCKDSDDNTVIVGFAVGANNEQQDVYASCTYATNTAACAADEDVCTQDVCSAGVCEKDFDVNLLDGDLDDDATTCPTKDQLIDLIGSITLSSTCFSGPSTDECTPGGNALVGLSDCETLTLANGKTSGLTWKRCTDADSNKVIVGYATGTNNKGEAAHGTCTYTTNTVVCSADSNACTQDVCGGGVCAKSYDADLRDGDLDAGPDDCPAASALSAVLPGLVSSCVTLDGSTDCSADGSPTAGYTGCVALSGSLGGLSWKRCADSNGNAVVLGFKQVYNNLGASGAQQVWGRCVYRTTGATCSSAQCADQVCSRTNDATLGTCGTVSKNTGSLCNTNVNTPYGGVFSGSNIGACVSGKCVGGPCKSDTAWAMPTLAQFQSVGGSYSAIKDFTTATPGVTGGRVRWWTFAGNNKWGGYFIFNDTNTLTTITVQIRGGAAQNDPNKGWQVGSVKLTYTPGARTVTFEGQFSSKDHYATSVSVLTTYDSNVGQQGISTGSPGQFQSWTTYTPAWTSSPAYANGIFGAGGTSWTFTASHNSAKSGSGRIMAGLHFDAKDLVCNVDL